MVEAAEAEEIVSSWSNVCEYSERLGSRQALSVLWNEIARLRGELLRAAPNRSGKQTQSTADSFKAREYSKGDEKLLALDRDETVRRLASQVATYAACVAELFAYLDANAPTPADEDQWLRTRTEITARIAKSAARAQPAVEADQGATIQLIPHAPVDPAPTTATTVTAAVEAEQGPPSRAPESPGVGSAVVGVQEANGSGSAAGSEVMGTPVLHRRIDTGLLASPLTSFTGLLEAPPQHHDQSPEARLAAAEKRVGELEAALHTARKENRDLRRLGQTLHAQLKAISVPSPMAAGASVATAAVATGKGVQGAVRGK